MRHRFHRLAIARYNAFQKGAARRLWLLSTLLDEWRIVLIIENLRRARKLASLMMLHSSWVRHQYGLLLKYE